MSKSLEIHPIVLTLIVALLVSSIWRIAIVDLLLLIVIWTAVAFLILYVLVWLFHVMVVRRRPNLRRE